MERDETTLDRLLEYGLEFYQFCLGYLESPSVRIADDAEEN